MGGRVMDDGGGGVVYGGWREAQQAQISTPKATPC